MKEYKVAFIFTDEYHTPVEGKSYQIGSKEPISATSKPIIIYLWKDDYVREWDKGSPKLYEDQHGSVIESLKWDGKNLNLSILDYATFSQEEYNFSVGNECITPDNIVQENDYTSPYLITPTNIIVTDKIMDIVKEPLGIALREKLEGVWKGADKFTKVAENENFSAEYNTCSSCKDSVLGLAAESSCSECAEDSFNVEFNDWADQEMNSHGKDISFNDWSKDEGLKHGNTEITDWAQHEDESHDARYEAETFASHGEPCSQCENGKMFFTCGECGFIKETKHHPLYYQGAETYDEKGMRILDIEDFNKIADAIQATGQPVTVLLDPNSGRKNTIDIVVGMDAPQSIRNSIRGVMGDLGYRGYSIVGNTSILERREYSEIRRVNGGHKHYRAETFESEFDFIHCSNCLFSKTGLNRCEDCNTQFVCRSQHGEDCNCYLFNAESFKSDEDLRITCPNCHGSKKMRIIDPLSDPYDPFPKYHKPIFYCLHCGGREGKMTTAQIEYDLRGMDELNPNWKEVFPIEKYGAETFEANEGIKEISDEIKIKVGKKVASQVEKQFPQMMWQQVWNAGLYENPVNKESFVKYVEYQCIHTYIFNDYYGDMRDILKQNGYDEKYSNELSHKMLEDYFWDECVKQTVERAKQKAPQIVKEYKKSVK